MVLAVEKAAELMQVTEKTVISWIKKEGLPACKVNDQYRLNKVDLLEWATDHGIRLSPAVFATPEAEGSALPSLLSAIKAGGINYGVEGDDAHSVLANVVELLNLPPTVDKDFMLQVLLAREALGTTAVGDGIAIPHVRNPILLNVPSPAISLSFLAKPIDFKAVDGKPVTMLFTLISPTVRVHLHMLARLAFALREEGFKTLLTKTPPPADIVKAIAAIDAEAAERQISAVT